MKSFLKAGLASAAIGLSGASYAQETLDADTVLAKVGDVEITLGHVLVLNEDLPSEYRSIEPQTLLSGILDQLIQQELLSAEADKESLRYRLAVENEARAVAANTILEEVSDAATTEEALGEVYEERYGAWVAPLEYRARHILVETEQEAEALVETLAGGADFAELAKEKSTGPSGPNGGDLGWFVAERMVPEFSQAVAEMEVGAISAPVQTQFGWHVIKLEETREVPPPHISEVLGELQEELRARAVEAKIATLEAEGAVERMEMTFDPQEVFNFELLDE